MGDCLIGSRQCCYCWAGRASRLDASSILIPTWLGREELIERDPRGRLPRAVFGDGRRPHSPLALVQALHLLLGEPCSSPRGGSSRHRYSRWWVTPAPELNTHTPPLWAPRHLRHRRPSSFFPVRFRLHFARRARSRFLLLLALPTRSRFLLLLPLPLSRQSTIMAMITPAVSSLSFVVVAMRAEADTKEIILFNFLRGQWCCSLLVM